MCRNWTSKLLSVTKSLLVGAVASLVLGTPASLLAKPPTPPPPPRPVVYVAIPLPTNLGSGIVARDVNKQGLTVGYSWIPGTETGTAFLYNPDDSSMEDLNVVAPVPEDCRLYHAHGINDAGRIAGDSSWGPFVYDVNLDPPVQFLRPDGPLGYPPGQPLNERGDVAWRYGNWAIIFTYEGEEIEVNIPNLFKVYSISDSRQLVGKVLGGTSGFNYTGFLYTENEPILYFSSSNLRLFPYSINGLGEFCGYNASKGATGDQAFRFTDGGLENIAAASEAQAMNTPRMDDENFHGDVAGIFGFNNKRHYFLYTDEHGLLDLNDLVEFENAEAEAKWGIPRRIDNSISISDRTACGFPTICVNTESSPFVLLPRLP